MTGPTRKLGSMCTCLFPFFVLAVLCGLCVYASQGSLASALHESVRQWQLPKGVRISWQHFGPLEISRSSFCRHFDRDGAPSSSSHSCNRFSSHTKAENGFSDDALSREGLAPPRLSKIGGRPFISSAQACSRARQGAIDRRPVFTMLFSLAGEHDC